MPTWKYGFLVEIRAQLGAAAFAFHRNKVVSQAVHFVLQDGYWLNLEQEGEQQNPKDPVLHRNKKTTQNLLIPANDSIFLLPCQGCQGLSSLSEHFAGLCEHSSRGAQP